MNCSCGCGKQITITKLIRWKLKKGQKNFYIRGHQPFSSKNNPRWKGGTYIDNKGYKFVLNPAHPNARKNGYVAEHHLVMHKHLNRPIDTSCEVIHHINGNKLDNNIQNLIVIKRTKHPIYHPPSLINRPPKKCSNCGNPFVPSHGNYQRNQYCSKACMHQAMIKEKASNAKLTQKTVDKIRLFKGKASHRELAHRFGISKTQIGRILRKESW